MAKRVTPQLRAGIIYRGPSLIDGSPIVVVAVFVKSKSNANTKTGPMVQTYILVDSPDVSPDDAAALGLDGSICGGCAHKWRWDATLQRWVRTCYVTLAHGPRVVWATLFNGDYPDAMSEATRADIGRAREVRLGTYGDPAAVPIHVWLELLADAAGHTGYSHQWRSPKFAAFRGLVMASCDNEKDRAAARADGWGTFTVAPIGQTVHGAELCGASEAGGYVTTCQDCQLCDGRAAADIWIPAHGTAARAYTGGRGRKVLPVLA
jgi:hypothetical protein